MIVPLARNSAGRSRMTIMHNEFTAIIERDDEWFIAYCAEIPGGNGQGRTADEARANLAEAIGLILEDRPNQLARKICRALSIPDP